MTIIACLRIFRVFAFKYEALDEMLSVIAGAVFVSLQQRNSEM